LVLVPVLFRHLRQEELGVWLLLGQSWAVLGVLDLGLGPTLARRIALAKGKSGARVDVALTPGSMREIADLFASGLRLFGLLAAFTLAIAWPLGYFYLHQIQLHELPSQTALAAWTILCVGQAFSVWAMVWSCLMIGLGYVGWDVLLSSAISLITIGVQIGASFAGGGLMALALIQAGAALATRVIFMFLVKRYQPDIAKMRGRWDGQAVRSMIAPAIRCWLTTLGGVLIMQTDQFFVAKFKGAAVLPSYRAAYLLCINIQMLAVTVASASAPFLSQLWQAQRQDHARELTRRMLRFGLLVAVCGLTAVLIGGNDLFTLWLGRGHFSGYGLLAVFATIMLFEAHSFMISTASRATEDEAFAAWSVFSGVLKLLLSYAFARFYGLIGIPIATLAAQCLTNYWYMGYRALKRLEVSLATHISGVVLPAIFAGAITAALGLTVQHLLKEGSGTIRLGAVVLACALVMAAGCWYLVLNNGQRRRVTMGVAAAVGLARS
jgi:O-antigen/teichoic acid export membrane protein